MTSAGIISLIVGLFQFPKELLALIQFLQSTPEEHREEAAKAVADSMDKFKSTGRPEW
jgi:hypothetical protein